MSIWLMGHVDEMGMGIQADTKPKKTIQFEIKDGRVYGRAH
jgi:hypothetical protein